MAKRCKQCNAWFDPPPSRPLEMVCSPLCAALYRNAKFAKSKKPPKKKPQKRIKPISDKRIIELAEYRKKRKAFLKDKKCPIYPNESVTDVHHMKGRVGYADQWARDNGVTLLLDERWWLAVSRKGHTKIERNPEWAYENGYSVKRLE